METIKSQHFCFSALSKRSCASKESQFESIPITSRELSKDHAITLDLPLVVLDKSILQFIKTFEVSYCQAYLFFVINFINFFII